MNDVIVIDSDASETSVVEIEVPRKPTPPLIDIEDKEIILNVTQKEESNIMAKDFIHTDRGLSGTLSVEHNMRPNHWTEDMIKFYNDDWGDEENFVVDKIQEKMDKTPSLWTVSKKDLQNVKKKGRRKTDCLPNRYRCWNCKQPGHHFTDCPEPCYVPKCHMCGSEGHLEYSCPNSKCLNCGNQSKEYVTCCYKCRNQQYVTCSRCQTAGHNFINCPDHWRLFHLTIGTTSVRIPDTDIHKSNKDIWCCNCGKKGHYHIQCMQRKDCNPFMDTVPFVVSYKNSFPCRQDENSGSQKRRHREHEEQEEKLEKILRLNPMHKGIKKDKQNLKIKFKILKKMKRNKKKEKQRVRGCWGPMIL